MTVACRSCGAPVWWAWTTNGKRMPVDAAPTPDGNLMAVDEEGTVLQIEAIDAAVAAGQSSTVWVARRAHRSVGDLPRWTSHFATCPQGPKWRKRDKDAAAGRFAGD